MRRGTQEPAQYVPRAIAPLPVASWDQTYSTEASQACAGLVILGDDFAGYCFAYDLAGQRYGKSVQLGNGNRGFWRLESPITRTRIRSRQRCRSCPLPRVSEATSARSIGETMVQHGASHRWAVNKRWASAHEAACNFGLGHEHSSA